MWVPVWLFLIGQRRNSSYVAMTESEVLKEPSTKNGVLSKIIPYCFEASAVISERKFSPSYKDKILASTFSKPNLKESLVFGILSSLSLPKAWTSNFNKVVPLDLPPALEASTDWVVEVLSDVSGTSSQNTSQNVTSTFVVWNTTIGNGESQSSDVIGQDSVSGVDTVNIFSTKLTSVVSGAGDFLDSLEQRLENISVVVGRDILQDRHQSFKTHTGVNVLGW
ncbi:hypothetical protein WICPIJ_010072 [Wickerhamomyces pijperi]|uniref:Uncharacterized protein n=1 Tax=Wickerhamomyces pijperi TaxID=599730 RepID=A0A9P8PIP4_WICPI|nr:hypothetical protein WICPIJ_010072 [Wickerhamomyces pijperi]